MVDALVKLLEKLTELLKYRHELREQRFDKMVEPVFETLKLIHRDYLQMFTACESGLRDGVDLSVVARDLMRDRLEQEAARRSIISLAGVFGKNSKISDFHSFFEAVQEYFYGAQIQFVSTKSSILLDEMEKWVKEEHRASFIPRSLNVSEARDKLLDMVGSTLESIREGWANVSAEYAKALSDTAGT